MGIGYCFGRYLDWLWFKVACFEFCPQIWFSLYVVNISAIC